LNSRSLCPDAAFRPRSYVASCWRQRILWQSAGKSASRRRTWFGGRKIPPKVTLSRRSTRELMKRGIDPEIVAQQCRHREVAIRRPLMCIMDDSAAQVAAIPR